MIEKIKEKIEKPWAVYGGWNGSWDIGRLISLSKDKRTGEIRYTEGQMYPPEYWDMKWVKTFRTSTEAAEYFSNNQGLVEDPFKLNYITKRLLQNFPTAMKQESVQSLYDILVAYQNKLISQSLPKYTKDEKAKYEEAKEFFRGIRSEESEAYPPTLFRRIDAMKPGYSEAND